MEASQLRKKKIKKQKTVISGLSLALAKTHELDSSALSRLKSLVGVGADRFSDDGISCIQC